MSELERARQLLAKGQRPHQVLATLDAERAAREAVMPAPAPGPAPVPFSSYLELQRAKAEATRQYGAWGRDAGFLARLAATPAEVRGNNVRAV